MYHFDTEIGFSIGWGDETVHLKNWEICCFSHLRVFQLFFPVFPKELQSNFTVMLQRQHSACTKRKEVEYVRLICYLQP